MRTVLTIGTFDPFHAGHAYLLKKCRELGDRVVVGVLSDFFILRAKGHKPKFSQDERLLWFETLADEAYIERGLYTESLQHPSRILEGDIDVLAVGSDWAGKDYYERLGLSQGDLDALEVTLAYVPRHLDLSATEIKGRIRE